MMAEIQDGHMFKRKCLRIPMFRMMLETQRTLRTASTVTIANGQCYNCSEKGYYARNCLKPRVRDSKYFIKQMLLAKQDEAGVNLTDEQNDFLFADASQMEEIKELSANICLMARIQPVNIDSEVGPSYISAFLRLGATFSVRRSLDRDSSFKDSVISNSKNSIEKVEVFDRTNKKPDVASKNVTLNNFVSNDEIKNALIMKNGLYVTCANNVLAPCHDHCLKKYKLSVRLNIRRALFTTPRTVKSRFKNTTHVLRLAITGYGDYVHDNITICHVYYIQGLRHNLVSVGEFCDGDLESAFRLQTCYMRNLEGDDLLTRARKSNLYTISISDMVSSSPVCILSKALSTKSWLWHRRLSHLNFVTINDLTKHNLVDDLLKFKYRKDHICYVCVGGKSKKSFSST
nr:retrovirus-related Pol polyprotein from transposon TNT 1-94 [Tanacetum cinerariifolium]